jgi:hypothetical protein
MSRNGSLLLLSILLLAGCVAIPREPPTPTPPAYIGQVYEAGILGYIWNLTDIRYEVQPNRVRLILEMGGGEEAIPYFRLVEVYNDQVLFPVAPDQEAYDPSWGEARIDITISDLYAYEYPLSEKLPILLPDNPLVTKIGLYPTYDDALLGFSIGLKAAAPYEVSTSEKPARIVIEVLK